MSLNGNMIPGLLEDGDVYGDGDGDVYVPQALDKVSICALVSNG